MKKIKSLLMLGLLFLAVTSCITPTDVIYLQDLTQDQPQAIPPVQLITIKPEDKLYINVHCRDENIASLFNVRGHGAYGYSRGGYGGYGTGASTDLHTYVVDQRGDIEFPVVGKIHVGGLTRQQAADAVKERLIEENLVKDPYVNCSMATAYFYTLGEIGGRGQVQIPKDAFTIIEAIAQCGDLDLQGLRTNVRVFREVNGQLRTYEVDLTSSASIFNSPVYYIQPNDIIYVEPTKKRQYETTALGNSVRTPSFWMSTTSTVISLFLTIYTLRYKL